jgi:predicted RND superfamily exporter protein
VFDDSSLLMAYGVGSALTNFPHIARISSPAHSVLLVAASDEISAHRFVVDGIVNAIPGRVELALADPLWRGAIISSDARVGALIVETDSSSTTDQAAVVAAIEEAIKPHEAKGFRFALSGYPWIHVASYRDMAADGLLVGTATIVVIGICFLFLIRSWQSTLAVLATIGFATGCGLGVIGTFGWSWDPIASAAPTLVLVLGSSDAIHFLTSYWRSRAAGQGARSALLESARETIAPCAMTSATSAAGLLSFVATDALAIAHFGAVAAAGVIASFVFTFTVLPALLIWLPDSPRLALRESHRWDSIIARCIEYPIRNRGTVLAVATAATLLGAFGLSRLTTDAHALGYWKSGDPTRTGIEFVSKRLSSIEAVELELVLPRALEDGESLDRLLKFQRDLAGMPEVRDVRSILTMLERVANVLGPIELDARNVGEVLTILALGDGSALDPWLSLDHRNVRISVSADQLGVQTREAFLARVRSRVAKLPADWHATVSGPSSLQQSIDVLVERAAIQSVSASSLLVTVLVMIFLRSVRWGALAMIPNLVPMVILFGLMGICGVALDAGAAVVAPIAIGIAVDDTIHFLHAYAGERRAGVVSVDAARHAAYQVGRAMVTTSGTLAIGFLAMLASRFQSAANIGLLSAGAIVAAFAAELLVLPALIATVGSGRVSGIEKRGVKQA